MGCELLPAPADALRRVVGQGATMAELLGVGNGMDQLRQARQALPLEQPRDGKPGKIHPTQKPVQLYKWLFQTFAEPGQRVLDTHLGSGSIAIAAHYAGIRLTACEIDADYYAAAVERVERETRQLSLFQ